MKGATSLTVLLAVLGWLLALPVQARGECGTTTQGFNTVYGDTKCAGTQGTIAFVDASRYPNSTGDICISIKKVLDVYGAASPGPNGVVVDARAFSSGTQTCSVSPWSGTPPMSNVVLLPAATIMITSQSLLLPGNTRLIGSGSGSTILKAGNNFSGDMIDMGNASTCVPECKGVVVEHLMLDGNNRNLNGIVNNYSQELSYVNDVVMNNLGSGIGLWLSVHADNSGPYTNISYSGSGKCVQIFASDLSLRQTRGIHGLTCIMGSSSTAAVYVDAPNNSLEDVDIQGGGTQQDGILIGSQGPAQNNILINVHGVTLNNVIHISHQQDTSGYKNCPAWLTGTVYNACDVTILGVTSGANHSIEDDLTTPQTVLADTHLGMYVVGEPVKQNGAPIGYSRLTTSTSLAPAWLVGTGAPSSSPCAVGSLYSNASGASGTVKTIYGCTLGGVWTVIQ